MAKLVLTDIAAGYALIATLNANHALIEAALENTLSRDGTSPNTMSADLDMNSNKVTNVTDGTNNQDAVTLAQLNAAVLAAAGGSTAATTINIVDSGAFYTGDNVELALAEIGASIAAIDTDLVNDTSPQLGGNLSADGNNINMEQNQITEAELIDYAYTSSSPSSSSNQVTFNINNGNSFEHTLTENTTLTISNAISSGHSEIIVRIVQDSTPRTISWPASVQWPGGSAPTLSSGSGAVDIVHLRTWDAGTTWYAHIRQDYS